MNKGFTIIELIISIFILQFAVIGVFNVFSVVTILTSDSADRLTGFYLAQEGMEIIKNIRDTNWLNIEDNQLAGYTWVDDLTKYGRTGHAPTDFEVSGCEADYKTRTPNEAWPLTTFSGTGNYLCNSGTGFYYYEIAGGGCSPASAVSKFKRKIVITPITDVDGDDKHIIKVEVYVAWDEKANIIRPSGLKAEDGLANCNKTLNNIYYDNCILAVETLYNWY